MTDPSNSSNEHPDDEIGETTDPTLRVLGEDLEATRKLIAETQVREPTIAGLTHIGMMRENNQDQYLVAKLERTLGVLSSSLPETESRSISGGLQGYIMIVADGMGGRGGGSLASSMVVDEMVHYALLLMPWMRAMSEGHDMEFTKDLEQALEKGQQRMRRAAQRKHLDEHLGTTLTSAYVSWPILHLVHIGDSRAYLYRHGRLARLTQDHNFAQEMVDQAAMTVEEAQNSLYARSLTRAVSGTAAEVKVDLGYRRLIKGDLLLLCSDGLTNELDDTQIEAYLARVEGEESVEPTVRTLIEAANTAGGRDNITVVLSRF